MGCTSSTEVSTDPHTGQKKTKHKLGGAYPGNRRQQNKPYQPSASQFTGGQATAHFVNYGGGNALVLKQDNGIAQPQVGVKPPEYIQVTLPDGVYGGQKIQVAAPDGRLNEIIVPDGFGPGSTFTVEFVDAPKPTNQNNYNNNYNKYDNNTYNEYEQPASYGNDVATTTQVSNMTPYVTNNSNNNYGSNNYSSQQQYKQSSSNNPPPPASASVIANTTGPTQDDGFASGFGSNGMPHAGNARPVYSQPTQYARPY